jgi:cell division protein FtsN
MNIRSDLIQQQESRTKTRGRSVWLLSLSVFLLITFASGFFIREKLVAQDSVQELESQVKQANEEDEFTFFETLPDLKMKGGAHYRKRFLTVMPQNHQPSPDINNRNRPKADYKQAAAEVSQGYTIQVAALRMQEDAEKIIQSLKTRGYSAYLVKGRPERQEDPWYRVRIGQFSGRSEAEEHLHELSERVGVRGFVTASIKNSAGL